MCRNLGTSRPLDAPHERRAFGAWVAGRGRKLVALYDPRPLQIAEVHNLGRCRAVFFLLAITRRRKRGRTHQRDTHTSHSNSFHCNSPPERNRALNWPKDTPPLRDRQDASASIAPIEHPSGNASLLTGNR